MFRNLKASPCITAVLSSSFLAFGLYNVHAVSGVTEGGVLGMTLLLEHWFAVSPAVSGFIMNLACYALGWRLLGRKFMAYSIISAAGFSVSYKICEQFDPLWPQLADMPLLACVAGAVFVGVGAGLCVRAGGAPGGDDALAMSISRLTHCRVELVYIISDLAVLALSLSYIPLRRIAYSVVTVLLSGRIIGIIQRAKLPGRVSTRQEAQI